MVSSATQSKQFSEEILRQLDKCADDFTFPMLDNGYVYPVESRLSAYRDDERWALIIEVVGFNCRAGGQDGIGNCLHIFGNCLEFEPGTNNANFLHPVDNREDGDLFNEEFEDFLNSGAVTLTLRGKKVQISTNPKFYLQKGIELENSPKIMIWEFLRGIASDYKDQFLASENEIRQRINQIVIGETGRLEESYSGAQMNSRRNLLNCLF